MFRFKYKSHRHVICQYQLKIITKIDYYYCYLFACLRTAIDSSLGGINVLKPTGHVMRHQFNIQQLYAPPTLYLCVLYLSENKHRLVALTA
jgi:hypothetical protein